MHAMELGAVVYHGCCKEENPGNRQEEQTSTHGARSEGGAENRHVGPELRGVAMDGSDKHARLLRRLTEAGSEERVWQSGD